LAGEDTHFAHWLAHAITALFLGKKSPQPFGRDILHQTAGVETGAGLDQHCLVEVGGEYLDFGRPDSAVEGLQEHHGNGISFLSGGTPCDPDADRFVAPAIEQGGKYFLFQHVKGCRITKKTGHADEHV
jgi:hypothetical protein